MKKILIVTDAWHPQVNGVVTMFMNLLPKLEQRGHSVTVIHPGMFFSLPMPGYPEIRLSVFSRRTIKRTIAEIKPDHIHLATEGPLGWAARRVCIQQKISFSSTFATRFDVYAEYRMVGLGPVVRHFLKIFHRRSGRVFVATPALQAHVQSLGISGAAIAPLGVDTDLFTRKGVPRDARLSSPVFAYFGRVASEKSVEDFLSCTLPGTKIVIGDGPEREALEKKYPAVLFVGVQKGTDLVNWLSQVDVCIFPSRTDTFGLTIIEALSCGIPVAAHDCLGPRDILTNGTDGFLGEDLAKAALQCLTLDRAQCRKKAEQYSWGRSAEAFIQNLVPVRDSGYEYGTL